MGTTFRLNKQRFQPNPAGGLLTVEECALLVRANALRDTAEEAYAQEKQRGYADGMEAGKAEMAERIFDAITKGVDFIEHLENTTVDLVMQSLDRVLAGMTDKERVTGVVRKALSYIRGQKQVTVRVSPDDAALLEQELQSMQADFPAIECIRLAPDRHLAAGSCLLESDLGIIDASLPVQMAALRRVFEAQLKRNAHGTELHS